VAQGVRVVTRRQTRIVLAGLVVAALLLMIALTGDGDFGIRPDSPLAGKIEGPANNALAGRGVLNLLLAAGIFGVILDAIIASYRERNARNRELLGVLRMLYAEIEINRSEAVLLLDAPNLNVGLWTDTVYKDDTWKEVRSKLSQLLPNEAHFNQLVAYYARNAVQERGLFLARKSGASLSRPGNAFAKKMAELQEEQKGLAVAALDMIEGYIEDPPVARESSEDAKREMERVQRELNAEKG
jgi:hypothetical protein